MVGDTDTDILAGKRQERKRCSLGRVIRLRTPCFQIS
ncbi:hypothetical protein [Sporosarcina sp. E16_8]